MTIQSAFLANSDGTAVVLNTSEAGEVIIATHGDDHSGGWRDVFEQWVQAGGVASPFVSPNVPAETLENFMTRGGYGAFQLLDLKDMEDKLRALSLELPVKSAAIRAWIDSARLSFATGQSLAQPPHSYEEVAAEVLQLLNQ